MVLVIIEGKESAKTAFSPSMRPRIRLVALAQPSQVIPTLNTTFSPCKKHEEQRAVESKAWGGEGGTEVLQLVVGGE